MTKPLKNCGDCNVAPGEMHQPGCDVETCARCGGQTISCGCIYEVCGIDRETMQGQFPDIYESGPSAKMWAEWDAKWDARRIPWAGEIHGLAECREYGFWVVWGPPWISVPAGTPDAMEDRNTLFRRCTWDVEKQRWVLPP